MMLRALMDERDIWQIMCQCLHFAQMKQAWRSVIPEDHVKEPCKVDRHRKAGYRDQATKEFRISAVAKNADSLTCSIQVVCPRSSVIDARGIMEGPASVCHKPGIRPDDALLCNLSAQLESSARAWITRVLDQTLKCGHLIR